MEILKGLSLYLKLVKTCNHCSRLLFGEDYLGNICGQNNTADGVVPDEYALDHSDRKYLYLPVFNLNFRNIT